jgi:integrase
VGRKVDRLTALKVSRTKTPGVYADGGGLYLQVTSETARSWIFRYTLRGVAREMGLGSLNTFGLSEARATARKCRQLCHDGVDPLEAREAGHAAAKLNAAKSKTFEECAASYVEAHRAGWKNPKHVLQWGNTLKVYADPVFGSLPVQAIDTGLVLKVLEPIWTTKPETAGRVRGRIEAVLDWAKVRGYREGENPARWRGHLDKLLAPRFKVRKVKHHSALPYDELPAFMAELRTQNGVSARALEFLILTGVRTGEALGARPGEVKGKVWIVPPERMKGGKEHRVPLSEAALAVLAGMKDEGAKFIFPGGKRGKPLSNMALLTVLRRMGRPGITVHGFRSSFRDWCAERTNYPREVAEMALAHAVSDKVEAAYRRGDLFIKRVRLMEEWARHCGTVEEQTNPTKDQRAVVPMHGRA